MKCLYPYTLEKTYRGTRYRIPMRCGNCMPCRIQKREEWAVRIELERRLHLHAVFVTLTYDPEHLPENETLVPDDLTNWLKRFRHHFGQFRYYACGEYGEKSWRPHYHAVLFGVPWTLETRDLIRQTWAKGFVTLDEFNSARARYVARYVTKKLNGDMADEHYQGREPEFARMSRRPGIGFGYIDKLVDRYRDYEHLGSFLDVTKGRILLDGKWRPLPRALLLRVIDRLAQKPDWYDTAGHKLLLDMAAAEVEDTAMDREVADRQDTHLKNRMKRGKL